MLQESSTWDLRRMTPGFSPSMRIYMLFLFVVCVVTSIKLIKVWRVAPPFRFSGKAVSPAYLQLLETSGTGLKQWIGCAFLAWGIFASITLYDVCNQLLDAKRIGSLTILFVIQDFSTALTMALMVVLFLFLVRWHMLERTERVRHVPDQRTNLAS